MTAIASMRYACTSQRDVFANATGGLGRGGARRSVRKRARTAASLAASLRRRCKALVRPAGSGPIRVAVAAAATGAPGLAVAPAKEPVTASAQLCMCMSMGMRAVNWYLPASGTVASPLTTPAGSSRRAEAFHTPLAASALGVTERSRGNRPRARLRPHKHRRSHAPRPIPPASLS